MQIFNLESSNSIFLNLSKAEGKQTIRVVDVEYVQGWRYYDAVRGADGKFVLDSNGQNKMKMFHVLDSKDIPSVLPPDRYGVQRAKFFLAFKVLHDDRICIFVITQRQILDALHTHWETNQLPPTEYDMIIERDKQDQTKYKIAFRNPSPVVLTPEQQKQIGDIDLYERLGIKRDAGNDLDIFLENP